MGSIVDRVRGKGSQARRYIVYRELNGQQKWVPCPRGTSMAHAKVLLATAEANVAKGQVGIAPKATPEEVRARRVTLAELVDRFCAEYTNPKIKSIERYRSDARSSLGTHVKPHRIANLPANEVTTQQLRDWRDEVLAATDGEEADHGPAPETVKKALALLSRLYNWANDKGLLDCRNPVSKVEKPVNHLRDDFDFLSADEVAGLLAWTEKHEPSEFPLYATAVYTGMRMGELYGLRWTDVDFDLAKIHIRRSYRTLPKSGKGRTIPLNAHLAPILRAWKERCRTNDENLVFPAPLPAERGKLTRDQAMELRRRAAAGESPANLARAHGVSWTAAKKIITGASWRDDVTPARSMRDKDTDYGFHAALKGAGCHRVRFHDLRHTFASHFMMAGGNILSLRDLLGHHDIKVTQKYAHLAPDHLAAEAARVSFQPRAKKAAKVVVLAERT